MDDLTERLVALQLTPHLGEKTLGSVLAGGEQRVSDCFTASEAMLREEYGFHPEAASHFIRRKEKLRKDAQLLLISLRRSGAAALHRNDPRYPSRFARLPDAPPLFYAVGDLSLLDEPSVCLLASSGATPETLTRLRALANGVAREGYTLVTGHNRDVYQASALAAAQHSSPVVYVLDCGLFSVSESGHDHPFAAARIHPAESQRRLFLSPFRPKDPWIGHNNRKRDRLIAAFGSMLLYWYHYS
ncbi:MAG: DNA-processing protein DprA, partial [Armatimonadetes bacterium]|nr:DNA-processing protein DprA [Armatimonadota bacterium]